MPKKEKSQQVQKSVLSLGTNLVRNQGWLFSVFLRKSACARGVFDNEVFLNRIIPLSHTNPPCSSPPPSSQVSLTPSPFLSPLVFTKEITVSKPIKTEKYYARARALLSSVNRPTFHHNTDTPISFITVVLRVVTKVL